MTFSSGGPEIDDYTCAVDFSDGWVSLTEATEPGVDVNSWAQRKIDEFNPLELTVSRSDVARELQSLAASAAKRLPIVAAALYANGGLNFATFDICVYGEDGVKVTPERVTPQLVKNKGGVGEPKVEYLNLSAGPAVRVQSVFKVGGVFGFGSRLAETVCYAVCPPEISDVVVATMRWEALERADELTELADEMIPTLRLVPLDSEGREITPGSRA